jgi:hypothetical protein
MTMTSLRGLAALALLCLLPRASALTITHTETLYATSGGPAVANSVYASTAWQVPKFNPALGTLDAMHVSVSTIGEAWSSDVNLTTIVLGNNPSLEVTSLFFFPNTLLGAVSQTTRYQIGPSDPPTIPPGGIVSYTFDYSLTLTETFNTDLSPLIGTGSHTMAVTIYARPGSDTIGARVNGTSVASVTYHYRVSDDSASTLAMFSASFVAVLFLSIHRRRNFSRDAV